MLVGIMGDVHGNVDALSATLDAFDRLAVKKIFCCGDVVGYGGAPGTCIDLLRERRIPTTRGNHDAYTVEPGKYNIYHVRHEANIAIEWTRQVLREDQMEWLRSLPMVLKTNDFMVTHASCQPYPPWVYVMGPRTAAMQVLFQPQQLCFNGHSHVPLIVSHRPGKTVMMDYLHDSELPKQGMVMVGVGAVGQPRDGDWRASAVLYDTNTRKVTLLRVPYDVATAQKRIRDAGLPAFLADRLAEGQ